jgi:C1A family cysteine protease
MRYLRHISFWTMVLLLSIFWVGSLKAEGESSVTCDPNCASLEENCIPCCDPACDGPRCDSCPEILPDDPIGTVRVKIAMRGYTYTVADNWISQLSAEEKERLFLRRGPVDKTLQRYLSRVLLPEPELPERFNLMNVDGLSYLGPIEETQDRACADCYAFATMAAAEGCFNRIVGASDDQAFNFSEAHLVWELGRYYDGFEYCEGADRSFDQLRAMVEYGAAQEVDCPYTGHASADCDVPQDNLIEFNNYYQLNGEIEQIKTAIYRYGPVYATVYADEGFQRYASGIYEDGNHVCGNRPEGDSYHAVALVGWDDGNGFEPGHWIVRNSWRTGRNSGPLWGENGYMRLAYNEAMSSCEVGVLVYEFEKPEPGPNNNSGCFLEELIKTLKDS